MAGADRIEGCLFGNGERTGNCDLVTVALNMYTQGIDPRPRLLGHRPDHRRPSSTATSCRSIRATPMAASWCSPPSRAATRTRSRRASRPRRSATTSCGDVPYLPIDPADLGRSYEAVIRVNSQSGKGGFAWVLRAGQGPQAAQAAAGRFSAATSSALADETQPRAERRGHLGRASSAPISSAPDGDASSWSTIEETRAASGDRLFAGTLTVGGRPSARQRPRQRPDLLGARDACARRLRPRARRASTIPSTRSATGATRRRRPMSNAAPRTGASCSGSASTRISRRLRCGRC